MGHSQGIRRVKPKVGQMKKCYSSVPNKRVGWNKHDGRKKLQNLINVLDGINVMEGKSHKI